VYFFHKLLTLCLFTENNPLVIWFSERFFLNLGYVT